MTAPPLRVAVVGLGPKGLYALERLLDRAARAGSRFALEIDVFEPHPVPGAGPVYEPGQPGYLRMNFAAELVDIWPADSRATPAAAQLSFEQWRARRAGDPDRDPYPSRGEVGRYLAAGLVALLRHAPPEVTIEIRRLAVTSIRTTGSRWRVGGFGFEADYDEVIVATGHANGWEGALANDWTHPVPLVASVFPVDRLAAGEPVAAGATVAIRGFALTFIDAALALTEGRGGTFERGDSPHLLRYRASGAEPARILPFSRTGEPMEAKPEPRLEPRSEAWRRAVDAGRARILALERGFGIDADLVPIVGGVAAVIDPAAPPAADPRARIQLSLAAASGHGPDDRAIALGRAWRALYPALVDRLGGDGVADREWPRLRLLSAEMERVSFGPPAVNAAKLLALIDVGIVGLEHVEAAWLESSTTATELRSPTGASAVDAVVDAVLAPPGASGIESPLLSRLLADGHARVRRGRRGIEVTADAACVAADGVAVRGLAACGRPTEDSVIGNDTLSRTLHPQLGRWAARVIARAEAPGPAAVEAPGR